MMPLGLASVGDTHTIVKITGTDKVRLHLAEMGFVVGERVTVVNELGGNMILVRQGLPDCAGQGHGHAHYGVENEGCRPEPGAGVQEAKAGREG